MLLLMRFLRTHGPTVTHAKTHLGIYTLSVWSRRVSKNTVPGSFRYVVYSFSTLLLEEAEWTFQLARKDERCRIE